jgi:hypothetical protein
MAPRPGRVAATLRALDGLEARMAGTDGTVARGRAAGRRGSAGARGPRDRAAGRRGSADARGRDRAAGRRGSAAWAARPAGPAGPGRYDDRACRRPAVVPRMGAVPYPADPSKAVATPATDRRGDRDRHGRRGRRGRRVHRVRQGCPGRPGRPKVSVDPVGRRGTVGPPDRPCPGVARQACPRAAYRACRPSRTAAAGPPRRAGQP